MRGSASLLVDFSPQLLEHAGTALARLGYLFPDLTFRKTSDGVEVVGELGHRAETIAKEVRYAFYREKIYAETLPMRRQLIDAVTRR